VPTSTLKNGGIVDAPRLAAFKSLVVADPGLGVEKHDHSIQASALSGVAIDDTVQATADVVRANAIPVAAVAARGAGATMTRAVPRSSPRRKAAARKRPAVKRTSAKKRTAKKQSAAKRSSTAKKRSTRKVR
jgi:hypothetical protein